MIRRRPMRNPYREERRAYREERRKARVGAALKELAEGGAELGLGYAEHKNIPYLLIPLFKGFDIAATFKDLNGKVILKACIKRDNGEIDDIHGKTTCRHTVINYEEAYGTTGEKLNEQEIKLSGLDDLSAFLMSWHAWKEYGNTYGEVFDPQIITQLIDKVPREKRPKEALEWFEEKTFNDLEEILKWDRPDHEFQKSRRGQALHVLGRMLSTEVVEDYVPVHFLDLVKEKLDKYLSLFFDVLREGDWYEKKGCAKTLGNLGEKAIPYLAQGLKDKNKSVRYDCALVLGNIGDSKAIPSLKKGLKDEDCDVMRTCARALEKIGEKAILALVQELKDEDGTVGWACEYALGKIKQKKKVGEDERG